MCDLALMMAETISKRPNSKNIKPIVGTIVIVKRARATMILPR
jgi:hypothetical protein